MINNGWIRIRPELHIIIWLISLSVIGLRRLFRKGGMRGIMIEFILNFRLYQTLAVLFLQTRLFFFFFLPNSSVEEM